MRTKVVISAVASAAFPLLIGVTPALAIPSPELVVGSLSSISQIVALVSAMLGGGAVLAGARASSKTSANRGTWYFAIACGICLTLSLAANGYQFASKKADQQARLEATLTLPTPKVDGRTLDPMLKEPSYLDQLTDPHGLSTAEVEKTLEAVGRGERKDVVFLDIRENAETEMGTMPGAIKIRFPDLAKAKLDLAGKTAILICHNGNRSFQTCQELAKLGIDCHYIIGGLEKWLVEGRSLTGLRARTLDGLRAVPAYPNQAILLDTPVVRDLVAREGAVFVDVRYPGEFSADHLPGAINLPIRPTPSEQLRALIAQLPHKPIIAPCYDRRSCFFGEVLGLELSRAGYDFRGRYTLPWEFSTAEPPRPYIQQWLDRVHQTWWDKLVVIVADALSAVSSHIGFLLGIVLLAALGRLLVLPVSVKTERDQIRSRAHADELKDLKARLKNDPRRLARAMHAFYKRNGLTPALNLIGLLFLPLMAVSVAAVHRAAMGLHQPLLWVANGAERDPYRLLPLVFAALICVYLDLVFVQTKKQRILIWAIGIVVFGTAGALLSMAADVYLIAAIAMLLVQRMIVAGNVAAITAAVSKRLRRDDWLIPLAQVDRLAGCGNKVHRLAQMRRRGIPVPDGVVLTSQFLDQFATATPEARRRQLDRLWRRLGGERAAVRSSAAAEDGNTHSFAGIFDSVLNVERSTIESAIVTVLESFGSERVRSYGVGSDAANILVQRMVDAQYSGVMFTRDPAAAGLMLVELVEGTAERLVSGLVAPRAFRFGRVSGHRIGILAPPVDLAPLIALGHEAEQFFGRPQDIEWVYAAGRFYLVQSRDITRVVADWPAHGAVDDEWTRIIETARGAPADSVVFAQNELAEVMPHPTPLSLSLMESLWASGGSVDLACRSLGLAYQVDEASPNYLLTIFGKLYVNKTEERARAPQLNFIAKRRLLKGADAIERRFREEFLPQFLSEMTLLDTADFDRLPTAELVRELAQVRADFVAGTHTEVDIVSVAADFYLQQARSKLEAAGLEAARYLAPAHETVFSRAVIAAENGQEHERRALLLNELGHRALLDYELKQPRYAENPSAVDALCTLRMAATKSEAIDRELASIDGGAAIVEAVRLARRFQILKEDAKHHSLRQLAVLRRLVLAMDRRFDLGGLAFHLTFDEIEQLAETSARALKQIAAKRCALAEILAGSMPTLGPVLTVRQIEDASAGIASESAAGGHQVAGTRVSGAGVVKGRACVVAAEDSESGAEIAHFRDGDIVVSTMVRPDWISYFRRAGGFVCEIGGWLSHTAILARECNVPMIVGTQGLGLIKDGAQLRLHPDGHVEIVADDAIRVAAE